MSQHKLSDEEKSTIDSLNCEDPFLCNKSPSQLVEMIFVNQNGYDKSYNSIDLIPKKDFSYLDNIKL